MYSILVLGGATSIGREFIRYLIETQKIKKLRVIDKILIETGFFSSSCLEAFKMIEYVQANLSKKGIKST